MGGGPAEAKRCLAVQMPEAEFSIKTLAMKQLIICPRSREGGRSSFYRQMDRHKGIHKDR